MRGWLRAAGLAVMCGVAASAAADTLRWVGPPGGRWTEPTNWSPPQRPTQADRLVFELQADGAIDIGFGVATVRSATFRAGTIHLIGDPVFGGLEPLDAEPVNLPALIVADIPGGESIVESDVGLFAPVAAVGVEGRGAWSTRARVWVGDVFVGVRVGASGIIELHGEQGQLRPPFGSAENRVTLGFEGDGRLALHDGASAEITELRLGMERESHGEVLVDGAQTVLTIDELALGAGSATVSGQNDGAVRFADGFRLQDGAILEPGPLTFDAVRVEGLHQIEFEFSNRSIVLRNGADVRVSDYVQAGEIDLDGPGTRLTTSNLRTFATASVTNGAAIELLRDEQAFIGDGVFAGGLEVDGGRVTLERIAESGAETRLFVGSGGGPVGQTFRLVNGAVVETEGRAGIAFAKPAEVRGASTKLLQTTQLLNNIFEPDRGPGGLLQVFGLVMEGTVTPAPLQIADGAEVRGSSVFLHAPTQVVNATLVGEEIMIVALHALTLSTDAEVRTPRLVLGQAAGEVDFGDWTPMLAGDGALDGDCSNGGVLSPGNDQMRATLRINGSLTQARHKVAYPESYIDGPSSRPSGDGRLDIDIASATDHDRLEVTGDALLGGALRIELDEGYTPAWGDVATFLTAGAIDGAFESLELPDAPPGLFYEVEYTDTTASLVLHDFLDLTRDFRIDGADLSLLLGSWGPIIDTPGQTPDLNRDGVVDGADLGVLLGAWGASAN